MPALAAGPDYDVPGRFALPWACGEGYRITWDPVGHWAHGKAKGIAYDFSMQEGTPLFAPVSGMAYFLLDERPFETNFGHYVEIVSEEGDWLVRLAHLCEAQSGERFVRAGELVGYSGSSGVPVEHLHLEVLVRQESGAYQGSSWVCPDLDRLGRFFGLPMTDFVEGAIITNDGCPAQVLLDGEVRPLRKSTRLGEPVELVVPLRNDGLEPVTLDTVQVSLSTPAGDTIVAEARGKWSLDNKSACTARVSVQPTVAGEWSVGRITYEAGGVAYGLPAQGVLLVGPSPLRLVHVSTPSTVLDVGNRIVLDVRIENTGNDAIELDDLYVKGVSSTGLPWFASVGHGNALPAKSADEFTLYSLTVPQSVGLWRIQQIGYRREDEVFFFDRVDRSFTVVGPELVANDVKVYASPKTLNIFLNLTNIGTRVALPDAIEVWGWKPDGEHYFSAVNRCVAPLAPNESALIQLEVPLDEAEGVWRLVEAGYWIHGDYYRIAFPGQPAISVPHWVHSMVQIELVGAQTDGNP